MASKRATTVNSTSAVHKKRKLSHDAVAHTRERVASGRITRSMTAVAKIVVSETPSTVATVTKAAPRTTKSRAPATGLPAVHRSTNKSSAGNTPAVKGPATNLSATDLVESNTLAPHLTATAPSAFDQPKYQIHNHNQQDLANSTGSTRAPFLYRDPQDASTQVTGNSDSSQAFIQATFGYTFTNTSLINEALDTTGIYRSGSNKNLALIGDSVLQTNIIRDWYPTRESRGFGNQLTQLIGSNANLTKVARRIGLDKHIVLLPNLRHSGPSEYMIATALEAVLGAIDCDSGESAGAVRDAMVKIGLTAAASD